MLRATGAKKGGVSAAPAAGAVCDKCDSSRHVTADCPHFRKGRENHPDALRRRKALSGLGSSGGKGMVSSARVVRQPGDGSCLYHSMAYGLGGGASAASLRREIAAFVAANPTLAIADSPLSDWVQWDSGSSVVSYAKRQAVGGWGGGIEMACCSRLKRVSIHVWERSPRGGYKRISCFDCPGATKVVNIIYQGGVHYDAILPGR